MNFIEFLEHNGISQKKFLEEYIRLEEERKIENILGTNKFYHVYTSFITCQETFVSLIPHIDVDTLFDYRCSDSCPFTGSYDGNVCCSDRRDIAKKRLIDIEVEDHIRHEEKDR